MPFWKYFLEGRVKVRNQLWRVITVKLQSGRNEGHQALSILGACEPWKQREVGKSYLKMGLYAGPQNYAESLQLERKPGYLAAHGLGTAPQTLHGPPGATPRIRLRNDPANR